MEDSAPVPSRLLGPEWVGQLLGMIPPSSEPPRVPPGMGNPPYSQPQLSGAGLVYLPLLLPPYSPHDIPSHSGVPPNSLDIEVPHQHPAGSLVVGRRELCLLTHCCLSTRKSSSILMIFSIWFIFSMLLISIFISII